MLHHNYTINSENKTFAYASLTVFLTVSPIRCCRTNWTHWMWPLRSGLWTWTETYSPHQTDLVFITSSWLVGSSRISSVFTHLMLFGSVGTSSLGFWVILPFLMVSCNATNPHLRTLLFLIAGHPITYPEYFSLNRTTAELRVLQPISRDFYQRFTLIIKVNKC